MTKVSNKKIHITCGIFSDSYEIEDFGLMQISEIE